MTAAPVKLVVSQRFDATPEAVFDAWLDTENACQWLFATPGGVMERVEINPRVGGGFVVSERRGALLATHFGTYVEIDRPRRLAFDFTTDREQAPTRLTVEFAADGAGCMVTLTHDMNPKWAEYAASVRQGWTGILNGLAQTLQGEPRANREIMLTRDFDAPRELVWAAWTQADRVDQWWGPDGFITRTETMDVRPGGAWRYTMTSADGTVYPNFVLYMDVSPPERLIYAHGGEEAAPAHFHVTVLFEALGERTRVTMRSLFPSKAARDHVVEVYGAIEGGKQTLARLADYLGGART
jgi:uncharacterized protein YndB with AHSA1/START domain